jgi:hypothetical protein
MGAPLSPYDRAVFECTLDAARASLGAITFDASWRWIYGVADEDQW